MSGTFGRNLLLMLQKNGRTLTRHYVVFIIVLLIPIFCVWSLSWTKPTITAPDLNPAVYESTKLDFHECTKSDDPATRCFQYAFYPYCNVTEDDPSYRWCLTERVAKTIAASYAEDNDGVPLTICRDDPYEHSDCSIVGFKDDTVFTEFMRVKTNQGDRVKGGFSVDENGWYKYLGEGTGLRGKTDPVNGIKLPYTIYYNNSLDQVDVSNYRHPLSTTNMVHSALLREVWRDWMAENNYVFDPSSPSMDIGMRWGFYPSLEMYEVIIDTVSTGAPIILSLAVAINYAVFSYFIVNEKQLKLRQALYIVGMQDAAFWLSHLILHFALAIIFSTLASVTLIISDPDWGKNCHYCVIAATFFLYFFASSCFILFLCSLLSNVKIAVFLTIIIFIAMLIGEIFQVKSIPTYFPSHFDAPLTPDDPIPSPDPNKAGRVIQQVLWWPTNFGAALAQIGDYTVRKVNETTSVPIEAPGFTFGMAFSVPDSLKVEPYGDWLHPVWEQWIYMVLNCVIYVLLGAWLDNILPFAHGSQQSPIFCFYPSWWGCKQRADPPTMSNPYKPREPLDEWDNDVRAEAEKLRTPWNERDPDGVGDIELIDLCKKYGKRPPAVEDMCLSIAPNSVFTLLGPNGAGKTTTISMLTGSLTPSSGYASILGYDIQTERTRIAPHIGLAPQHDILWSEMTCIEHIIMFAKLRGVNPSDELERLMEEEDEALKAGIASSMARSSGGHGTLSQLSSARMAPSTVLTAKSMTGVMKGIEADTSFMDEHYKGDKKRVKSEINESGGDAIHTSPVTGGTVSSDLTGEFHSVTTGTDISLISTANNSLVSGARSVNARGYEKHDPLRQMALARLEDVGLRKSADVPVRALSGGMRRRLTLAIALLGSPRVVFLDEPTTGLDPASRRQVWDLIIRSKKGKCIILTTHSMEEADVLSDRIGIMARGCMRCLGSSPHLKRVYGLGYRLDLETLFDTELQVSNVMKVKRGVIDKYVPEARLISKTGGHLTLALPRTLRMSALEDFLNFLEDTSSTDPDLIKDWSLRQTTLEEVFLAIVRLADRAYERKMKKQSRIKEIIAGSK